VNYFVTGASGFIGQHLVRRLLRTKTNVIYCLVRDEKKLPTDICRGVKILRGDGSSIEQHASVIRSCAIIFHIGGRADLGNGDEYRRDNIEFTDTLIHIAEGSKKLKRFVFTSTIGAVDRTKHDPCTTPLREDSKPNPLTDYGKSKLACEQHLTASELPFVIVRPALVYGPGMRRRSHLRAFIDAVVNNKAYTRFNFPGKLSFIYVDDLIDALIVVSKHPKLLRQIYFAADNEPISIGSIFQQIGRIFGKKAGTMDVPFPVSRFFRAMRPYLPLQVQNLFSNLLIASNAKLRSLGFAPKRDLAQGFRETAHYHFRMENPGLGVAIVTGGASGIGRSLSEQLYARGYSIVVVDRDKEKGMELAKSLQAEFIHADLTHDHDVQHIVRFIQTNADQIDLLVNNAGVGKRGNTEEIPSHELADVLALNCEAPVKLTNAVLPVFIKHGHGTLVNIGSSAGYQPLPYMSVYAASKAFIIRYTQALQGELAGRRIPSSVEVILVSPSGTATNFQKNSGVKEDDAAKLLQPEDVAAAIIQQIGKGSTNLIIGSSGKGMALAARFLPTRVQIRLWERLMRSMR